MKSTQTPLLLLFAMAAVALWGCGGEPEERIIYMDHPVEFDDDSDPFEVEGDPNLMVGVVEDGEFFELADGADVTVIDGFQGGNWLHITIRATGVVADGMLSATLGDLGSLAYPLKLTRGQGYLEAVDIPVPVQPPGGDVESVYGTTQTLDITFSARGTELNETLDLVLVRP